MALFEPNEVLVGRSFDANSGRMDWACRGFAAKSDACSRRLVDLSGGLRDTAADCGPTGSTFIGVLSARHTPRPVLRRLAAPATGRPSPSPFPLRLARSQRR